MEDCVNIPRKSHLAQKVETSYTKDKAAIDVVSLMEIYLSRSAPVVNAFQSYLQRLITNRNITQKVKKCQKISEIRTFYKEN